MSFFRYIGRFLFISLTVIFLFFLGIREYYLLIAQESLKVQVNKLMTIKDTPQVYQRCMGMNSGLDTRDQDIVRLQLRFLNDQDYVLEAACFGYDFAPELIDSASLPKDVYKRPGSSGVVLVDGAWELSLYYAPKLPMSLKMPQFMLSRTASLMMENSIWVDHLTEEPDYQTPAATCAGFGYHCCDLAVTQGTGESRPATDCVESCFAECLSRPVVLSFTAQGYDQYTRILNLPKNQLAQFYFQTSNESDGLSDAVISFGDGQSWTGKQTEEPIIHAYTCDAPECAFIAELKLVDQSGSESVPSNISKINVIIK